MDKYNIDKLVKVQYKDFERSRYYTYVKQKRFLSFVIQKEGIYINVWGDYIGLNVPQDHTLKDCVIYENPKVILYYQGDYSKTYYFNSFIEAKKFSDEITSIGTWIS